MMNNKILILILLVLVAAAAGFYLINQNAQDNGFVSEQVEEGMETVLYTENGYSPSSIRVQAGTEVRFVNQGPFLMWTASDPHPTHQILPQFDALRGYPLGEAYAFVFDNPGTWKYHNHLNPNHVGEVIVE